ncbi:MAG TPA: 2OG-Fe(II) oxygenase [Acetobacteraceae bacterium]|nr:2OG-Fe(II) oxygenase [Acetobacteraceae bacterium]
MDQMAGQHAVADDLRIGGLDPDALAAAMDANGAAVIPGLLDADTCVAMVRLFDDAARFRKRVVMEAHAYGRGEYQYFAYPLPQVVAGLRAALYPPLAAIANRWAAALGEVARFPADHAAFLACCHAAGQTRPTPLLLRYGPGDYNRLHQDVYGAEVFPLQVVVLLSPPGAGFCGGEFVLTEQRARMQSRVEVVTLAQGDAVVFPVHHRPVTGPRGVSRAVMRHGVSRVRAGARMTLGIIFHDAA